MGYNKSGNKGIYLHIPFCKSRCHYCDFNTYSDKNIFIEPYIEALKKEIDIYGRSGKLKGADTIFFGGGTPSSINSIYIEEILEKIYEYADRDCFKEITLEANPGTVNELMLNVYKRAGISRISMGVQSFNDKILKDIGRIHDSETVIRNIEMIKKYIDNISIDIIFGLPNQTADDIEKSLTKAAESGVSHISFYALKVEDGTEFARREEKGLLNLPSEDEEREMYHIGKKILEERGFFQYEISNFAKKGFESKHNLVYWNVRPYIGMGLSAASNIDRKRYSDVSDFETYFRIIESGRLPIDEDTVEVIEREEEISEYCILRLRLNDGIVKSEFQERYGEDINDIYGEVIEKHLKDGLLEENEEKICLSDRGFDLANQVYVDFLI